eukprot:12809774-Alexandrium_andersonii.AAC.1
MKVRRRSPFALSSGSCPGVSWQPGWPGQRAAPRMGPALPASTPSSASPMPWWVACAAAASGAASASLA